MADSDNTTTLPVVASRRKGQKDVAEDKPDVASPRLGGTDIDQALATAQAWQAARATTRALCRKQQQLETQLAADIGFPPGSIKLSDGTQRYIASIEHLREAVGQGPFDAAAQKTLDHWQRWRERDVALGYSAVKAAEQRAANDQQALLDELARTPASSLASVIAKLSVLLSAAEDNVGILDGAVPHIRSVLDDLKRITGTNPDPAATDDDPSNATAMSISALRGRRRRRSARHTEGDEA